MTNDQEAYEIIEQTHDENGRITRTVYYINADGIQIGQIESIIDPETNQPTSMTIEYTYDIDKRMNAPHIDVTLTYEPVPIAPFSDEDRVLNIWGESFLSLGDNE